MKSQNITYNPRLDELRGLACLMVFVVHFYASLSLPTFGRISFYGVELFFTLSGFLFGLILYQKNNISYLSFVANRFLRIFPLYLIFMFAIFSSQWQNISFVYMLDILSPNVLDNGSPRYGRLWSIGVEFYFYLILPFIMYIINLNKNNIYKVLFLAIFIKLIYFGFYPKNDNIYYSLIGQLPIFIIGILFSLFYKRQSTIPFPFLIFFISFVIICMIIVSKPFIYQSFIEYEIISILCGVMIVSFLYSKQSLYIHHLGKVSFSFYLWHTPIIYFINKYIKIYISNLNFYYIIIGNYIQNSPKLT